MVLLTLACPLVEQAGRRSASTQRADTDIKREKTPKRSNKPAQISATVADRNSTSSIWFVVYAVVVETQTNMRVKNRRC